MPKGLVSAELSSDSLSKIAEALGAIRALLPFLVALAPDQRRGGLKLGPKSVKFVQAVYTMAAKNPDLIPPGIDLPEFAADVKLVGALDDFLPDLAQLTEAVQDTRVVAGGEAMTVALQLYGIFQSLKKTVPGLDDVMKEMGGRWKRPTVAATAKDPVPALVAEAK